MNAKTKRYLDNCFAARQLPGIAWGAFLPFLIQCVKADGGTWNEIHNYFEFPPNITGKYFETISAETIKKYLKW